MKIKEISSLRKFLTRFAVISLMVASMGINVNSAQAASVTSLSDVMSRLKASTASNHEIKFVTPTGVASGQTIILTFSAGFTGVTNIVHGDVDFAEGDSGNCSTANFAEKTLAASPSGTTWGADGDSSTTVTITSGTGTVTAGRCVRIKIGTNATSQTTGSNQITNGSTGSNDTVAVSGSFGDTGTLAVDIITDDQVTVTATVDPTITFAISDNTIGFGSLSASAARYATGTTGSGSDAEAFNATVATNAASGYVLTYNGATLTSGANNIDVATITADANGTPGTEQFACGVTVDQGSTIVSAYDHSSNNWSFVASTTTTVVSRTTPTNTETVGFHCLANVAGNTPAGTYATTVTLIGTGTF